jgi:hypothetical protein
MGIRDWGLVKSCSICAQEFEENADPSVFAEAGEWLAAEVWQDAGELCPQCRESRGKLAMMYLIDR